MSFSTSRQEIADALSTVDGVTGYPKRPTIWSPGDAVVYLDHIDHMLGVAWQATWRIHLALSGDEATSVDQMDELFPLVCEALNPVAFVDSAAPQPIPTDNGQMVGVVIFARSE